MHLCFSRSKDIIEPRLKDQWFVKCDQMAKSAVEAVSSGKLKLNPSSYEKLWFNWMENTRLAALYYIVL